MRGAGAKPVADGVLETVDGQFEMDLAKGEHLGSKRRGCTSGRYGSERRTKVSAPGDWQGVDGEVHYDEGVATHIGPDPCAGLREGVCEASVGECTDRNPPGERIYRNRMGSGGR
jgi:hypothetical protein